MLAGEMRRVVAPTPASAPAPAPAPDKSKEDADANILLQSSLSVLDGSEKVSGDELQLMKEAHEANAKGDARTARRKFEAAYNVSGRLEARISAANMMIKLGEVEEACREFTMLMRLIGQADDLPEAGRERLSKLVERKYRQSVDLLAAKPIAQAKPTPKPSITKRMSSSKAPPPTRAPARVERGQVIVKVQGVVNVPKPPVPAKKQKKADAKLGPKIKLAVAGREFEAKTTAGEPAAYGGDTWVADATFSWDGELPDLSCRPMSVTLLRKAEIVGTGSVDLIDLVFNPERECEVELSIDVDRRTRPAGTVQLFLQWVTDEPLDTSVPPTKLRVGKSVVEIVSPDGSTALPGGPASRPEPLPPPKQMKRTSTYDPGKGNKRHGAFWCGVIPVPGFCAMPNLSDLPCVGPRK